MRPRVKKATVRNPQSKELDLLLTCPICLDDLNAPTYQCTNGHLICAGCEKRIQICPECRYPYTNKKIRNLVADTLIEYRYANSKKSGKDNSPWMEDYYPGAYQVISECVVSDGVRINSNSKTSLISGEYVDILEIENVTEDDCLRGRLESGGWISLYQKDGHMYAMPLNF